MRALILISGACLALTACGDNKHNVDYVNTTANVDQNDVPNSNFADRPCPPAKKNTQPSC